MFLVLSLLLLLLLLLLLMLLMCRCAVAFTLVDTDGDGIEDTFTGVTTNAGAADAAKQAIGFGSSKRTGDDEEAINRLFTPEFRNRLDAIVQFGALPLEVVKTVADKFLTELQAQLDDKRVTLEVEDEALEWLARESYDEKMGARPMQRLIQDKIKRKLAEDLLFGDLSKAGGTVRITVENDDIALEILSPVEA